MNSLFTLFMYLSGIGAIGGIYVHLMTVLGLPLPFPENILAIPLTLGVLLAGLVAVLAIRSIAKKCPEKTEGYSQQMPEVDDLGCYFFCGL